MKNKFFFGRIKSRKVSRSKELNLKKFLNRYKISKINKKKALVLEIGIGMGEHLIHLSKKNKTKIIIGVDPFKNGMANVSDLCFKERIKNIFLYPFVVENFFDKFKKLRFESIYILFPDPWPKKRHSKRRIINDHFLKKITKFLKKKGKVIFSTDNIDYFNNVKTLILGKENIRLSKVKENFTFKTKYFKKAIKKGNTIKTLRFYKI